MRRKRGGLVYWGVLLFLMLFTAGLTVHATAKETKAAVNGFQRENGKTYYYQNGVKYRGGFLKINGKYYYFTTTTGQMMEGWAKNKKGQYRYFYKGSGVMATGWVRNSKNQMRYFYGKSGVMATGWITNTKGQMRYFYNGNGFMATGWVKNSKNQLRYFYKGSGVMATGWVENSSGEKRYFDASTGIMATGFTTVGGKTYYLDSEGFPITGWVKNQNGDIYYFDNSGAMATGALLLNGFRYTFSSDGVLQKTEQISSGGGAVSPTGKRTVKDFLANALLPVGNTLYMWGGGHNSDATRKGVSPNWINFYNTQNSSYNFNNYRDLSATNVARGLDCSGYVGWSVYQVMHSGSGEGSGYTLYSGDIGSVYSGYGWGTVINQSYLSQNNYKLYPGDIAYNSGHTWIVLGQCSDQSVVLLHSTPNAGVQISGTSTPDGNSSSQAVALAQQYMSRYPGYSKYEYHTSVGNFIKQYNFLRWNTSTLSDPDGFRNMTANQILARLFS